jgi:hypothetical protein
MGDDELRSVASAANDAEAAMLCDRLLQAGIHAITQRTLGGPEWGLSGARAVFVSERDLDRARAILDSGDQPFSDEELTQLSEEAGRDAPEQ